MSKIKDWVWLGLRVPPQLRKNLKVVAAMADMTLADYIIEVLQDHLLGGNDAEQA